MKPVHLFIISTITIASVIYVIGQNFPVFMALLYGAIPSAVISGIYSLKQKGKISKFNNQHVNLGKGKTFILVPKKNTAI